MANDYENGAQQNPEVQSAVNAALAGEKKKKKKKRWIIFAVIAVVIIVIIALTTGGKDTSTATKVDSVSTSSSESTTSKQATSFKAGDVVKTDDLQITYKSANANWTGYDEYSAPEKGKKIVRAEFEFENTSSADTSLSNFDCYADSYSCDEYYSASDYKSPTLESISAGKKVKAVVYYEVPSNAKKIVLQYETNYWSSDHIEFVIK